MQSTKVDVNVSADCDADAGADSSRQLGALLVPLARITLAPPSSLPPSLHLPPFLSLCLFTIIWASAFNLRVAPPSQAANRISLGK